MILPFSEALRRLRIEKGYSQQRLAEALHVDRSTVTKWETGDRVPDAVMIALLSDCLGVNVAELLHASEKSAARPVVMMVDDENIILRGSVPILEKAIPDAEIAAFTIPAEAVAYAKVHPVSLAFLIKGDLSLTDFIGYIIAQFAGAFASTGILAAIFGMGLVTDQTGVAYDTAFAKTLSLEQASFINEHGLTHHLNGFGANTMAGVGGKAA